MDSAPEHIQSALMDASSALNDKLSLPTREEQALNRLIGLVKRPPRDSQQLANEVGKICVTLGIKPDFSF